MIDPWRRAVMPLIAALLFAGTAAAAPVAPAVASAATPTIVGTWMNPRGTVAVRTGACGDRLCGWVVWASAQAQEDARDGGTTRLVGTALLENYRADGDGGWAGTVFVPDRNQRFYSEIAQVDADAMELKGCILHGLICRSQVWHRIAELPRG